MNVKWTPLLFDARAVVSVGNTLLLGGEGGERHLGRITETNTIELTKIPVEPSRYDVPNQWGNGLEIEANEVNFGDSWCPPFHVDRSVTPFSVSCQLGEYQGGSFGVSIFDDIHDFDSEVFVRSPNDSDIPFGDALTFRDDEFVTYSCYDLFHYVRDGNGEWKHTLIPLPYTENLGVNWLSFSFDATHLVAATDSPIHRTVIYERIDSRFQKVASVPQTFEQISLHENRSIATTQSHLWIYDDPCLNGLPSHRVKVHSLPKLLDSTDRYSLITSLEKSPNLPPHQNKAQHVVLIDNARGAVVREFHFEPNALICAATFIGNKVVFLLSDRVGVFDTDFDLTRSRPARANRVEPVVLGYERAMEVFNAFSGFPIDEVASDIVSQLVQSENDPRQVAVYLWRGIKEKRIEPSVWFAEALLPHTQLYDAEDVITFMSDVDHDDVNIWSRSHRLILEKFPKNRQLFTSFWRTTSGVLRADFGLFLVRERLITRQDLPQQSLMRETYQLARTPVFHDRPLAPAIERIRRIYSDAEIAHGLLEYAATAFDLGFQGGQWFELVWPHASPEQRVMLIQRITREEGALFFGTFFESQALDSKTRDALEAKLTPMLAQEPTAHASNNDESDIFRYTFFTAAIVLGLDAKKRGVGLSATGGAIVARAMVSNQSPSDKLTPTAEKMLSSIFGV